MRWWILKVRGAMNAVLEARLSLCLRPDERCACASINIVLSARLMLCLRLD